MFMYSERGLPRGHDGPSVREGFSAMRRRVCMVPGAFERPRAVPNRKRRVRRCSQRHSDGRWRKLRWGRGVGAERGCRRGGQRVIVR